MGTDTSLLVLLFTITAVFCKAPRLQTYNVDNHQLSVSGISSGGIMTSQLHVIYSSKIMGAGIIAGVPFACSGGTLAGMTQCMKTPALEAIYAFEGATSTGALFGNVDATSHMRNDKVYIFAGTKDSVVHPGNGPNIQKFYQHYITKSQNIKTVFNMAAEHCMPTENYGGPCGVLSHTSFLNNCGYNAAFDLLNFIYGGNLQKPSNSTTLQGQFLTFDQTEFFTAPPITYSFDNTGYLYVPLNCVRKYQKCKLHVALHGCAMGRHFINDVYAKHAGYNEVGELNNIIILYPQVTVNLVNPSGCWDGYGFTGAYFATNKGFQIVGLQRMMERIMGTW